MNLTEEQIKGLDAYIARKSDGWLEIDLPSSWVEGRYLTTETRLVIRAPRLQFGAIAHTHLQGWVPAWNIPYSGYPYLNYPLGIHFGMSPAPDKLPQCQDWRDAVWYSLRPERLPSCEPFKPFALQAIGPFDPLIVAVILATIGRS